MFWGENLNLLVRGYSFSFGLWHFFQMHFWWPIIRIKRTKKLGFFGFMFNQAMESAGKKFVGEHDFRNFCKMDALNVHNYMRKITSFAISPCDVRLLI